MVVLTEQNIDKFVWLNRKGKLSFSGTDRLYNLDFKGFTKKGAASKNLIYNMQREVVMPKCLIQW